MRYHLFQKFFGKMVKVQEMSFLSPKKSSFSASHCMCIFVPRYYIAQNENLELYVSVYHQIPAPVLPWQIPENFNHKSVQLNFIKSKN